MAYKEPIRKISLNESLCRRLEEKKESEGRHGSLTLFAVEILDGYLRGFLVKAEPAGAIEGPLIRAAKIESTKASHEQRKTG